MNMLHCTLLVLAEAQYRKARAYHGVCIQFDVPKDASISSQALAMTLEERTNRHSVFFGNVVSFAAELILAVQPSQEGWADGSVCFIGLDSNQSYVLTFWALVGVAGKRRRWQ
jgi:hypothetical protein